VKPIEVPDSDDDRVRIPFTVPIKGRKPLVFNVPRIDFIPAEDVKTIIWLITELDHDKSKITDLADPDAPGSIERAGALLMLRPHVTDTQFATLKTLVVGQLKFIRDRWQEQSRVTLGEYWASSPSSKSTGRQSNSNSSNGTGTSGTSDEPSAGLSSVAS
jgi:transcriptional regulator of heat shock response